MNTNFLILLLLLLATPLFAADAWPGVKFAEARAYHWLDDGSIKEELLILKDMSLKDGVLNPKGDKLSEEQVAIVLKAVNGEHPDYPVAACYIPHHAIVFYDEEKKPVAFLEICFSCAGFRAQPKGLSFKIAFPEVGRVFTQLKIPRPNLPGTPKPDPESKGVAK